MRLGAGRLPPTPSVVDACFAALEAETGACKNPLGLGAECKLERKRQKAMTRMAQLLNMFYDMIKNPNSQSRNEGKTADQLWTALKTHYTDNEALLEPNFPDQAKAAWLKTAKYGEAAPMADTARDMKTFQNDVLSSQMGFKRSAGSFEKPARASWTKAGR
jgi:hypothetical protein